MKYLVIHPDDRSTDFLSDIYKGLENYTLVTQSDNKEELIAMIRSHDYVFMLGHGCGNGLLGVGKFPGLAVDDSFASALKEKGINLCGVWCHADDFFNFHGLSGFYTGMIISEVSEANFMRVKANQDEVTDSNRNFAKIIGEHLYLIDNPYVMAKEVKKMYGIVKNGVTKFNMDRIYGRKRFRGNKKRKKILTSFGIFGSMFLKDGENKKGDEFWDNFDNLLER